MIVLFKKRLTPAEMENIKNRICDPNNFPTEEEYIQYAKQKWGDSKKDALIFMNHVQSQAVKAKYNIE